MFTRLYFQSETTHYPVLEQCISAGWFPAPGTYCNSFYLCIESTGGFELNKKSCSGDLMFDPVSGYCTSNFECPEKRPLPGPENLTCENTCKFSGMFSYEWDCAKYINCAVDFNSNSCNMRVEQCPYGLSFNGQYCDSIIRC